MSDVTSIGGTGDRRWLILGVLGLAQVMVIMSLTQTLGYSPLVTGVVFLPLSAGLVVSSNLSTIVATPRVAPQDAGEASATVTVGQQLGASVGISLVRKDTPSPAPGGVTTAKAQADPARPG
jgi:predicted MFS family arabinose efflux permease